MGSAKTKAQLVEENDNLRQIIKDMKNAAENLKQKEEGEFTNRISLPFVDENGKFKIAEVQFNPVTGQGRVDLDSVEEISSNDNNFPIAVFEGKKKLQNYMDKLCNEHLERK